MYSFKLMSFNIAGYDATLEAARRWESRAAQCINILHNHKPDLIGLQEVQVQNRATLDKYLTRYACEYGAKTCFQTDENTVYNPIYWRPDRFEMIDAGSFYLSETPEVWSKTWDAMQVRSATWIRLRCIQSNATFIHTNVHLDHYGSQARIESSKLIVAKLMQLRQVDNSALIVSGDFNARAWVPADEDVHLYNPPILPHRLPAGNTVHQIYTDRDFKDVYLEAGYKNQLSMNTYHSYYGDSFPPVALRIDWILILNSAQRIRTQKYFIIDDANPPIYPSDHYPIMAELAWY